MLRMIMNPNTGSTSKKRLLFYKDPKIKPKANLF